MNIDNYPDPNPYAPKGTLPWALYMATKIHRFLNDNRESAEHLEAYVSSFQAEKGYALLQDDFDQPFASFEAWYTHPMPHGLACGMGRQMNKSLFLQDVGKTARFIIDQHGPDYARKLSEQLREELEP